VTRAMSMRYAPDAVTHEIAVQRDQQVEVTNFRSTPHIQLANETKRLCLASAIAIPCLAARATHDQLCHTHRHTESAKYTQRHT
jgi:hypothetical protein